VRSEVRRLKKMNPSQLEYGMLRSYLETVADLPWNNASEDCNDMKVAEV
jgi:ATP-dependent Lon protease